LRHHSEISTAQFGSTSTMAGLIRLEILNGIETWLLGVSNGQNRDKRRLKLRGFQRLFCCG
jgi:hypothetical protein